MTDNFTNYKFEQNLTVYENNKFDSLDRIAQEKDLNKAAKETAEELFSVFLDKALGEVFEYKKVIEHPFDGGNGEEMSRKLLNSEYMKQMAKDGSFENFTNELAKEVIKLQEKANEG